MSRLLPGWRLGVCAGQRFAAAPFARCRVVSAASADHIAIAVTDHVAIAIAFASETQSDPFASTATCCVAVANQVAAARRTVYRQVWHVHRWQDVLRRERMLQAEPVVLSVPERMPRRQLGVCRRVITSAVRFAISGVCWHLRDRVEYVRWQRLGERLLRWPHLRPSEPVVRHVHPEQ